MCMWNEGVTEIWKTNKQNPKLPQKPKQKRTKPTNTTATTNPTSTHFAAVPQQLELVSPCKNRTDQKISLRKHLIYATSYSIT